MLARFSAHVDVFETYFQVMSEHISGQAFVDFRYYNLVEPLEVWRPKLSIQNDNRGIGIGF